MPTARTVDEFRTILNAYLDEADNPDFVSYSQDVLTHYEHWIWEVQYLMGLGNLHGKRILDIGCGFGWHALGLAVLGGNVVVANDIRQTMISALAKRLEKVEKQFGTLGVEPLLGDICAVDIAPNSYGGIYCHETLEHVHDVDRMFNRCYEILQSGGRAVFTNDNNAVCRASVRENGELWQKRDRDWAYIDALKKERPVENAEIEPYAAMRERIVRGANAELADPAVALLVDASAGMVQAEIEALARNYRSGNSLPVPPKWSWCRNPETGEYCERLLDPFELKSQLEGIGFNASVHHMYRKWPLCTLNGLQLKPLHVLFFQLRPAFVIVAEKP